MTNARRIELALLALIVIAAAVAIAQSWNRCLDPIIDTGRDLYISEQLHHGTRLYGDIRYNYPPLAPYLLAAITAVTGNSLRAYAAIGLVSGLLIAAALYFFLRKTAGLAAALLFVACYLCGASTFGANYLFPYSYAATLGMLFFIVFGALLYRHLYVAPGWALAGALLCGLAAAWSRIELAACVLLIVLFVAIVHRVHAAWLWFAAMLILIAIAAAFFGPALRDNVLSASLLGGESARVFYRRVTGLQNWPRRLALSAIAAVVVSGAAAMIALLERVRAQRLAATLLYIALAVATALMTGSLFFNSWSILQLVLLPFALRRPREPLLLLLLLSLVSTARVYLNLSPAWYGFVFTVPALVLIVYTLFEWLPAQGFYSKPFALLWLPALILISGRYLYEQREAYALKTERIATGRGVLYDANRDRARALNEALPLLRGAQSLAVFPEGLTLNYLAGVKTPLTFHTFIPPETADPRVEQRILAELQSRPPEYVAIVTREVREFGYRGFAIDYDQRIGGQLRQDYQPVARWPGATFSLVILRRRDAEGSPRAWREIHPPSTGLRMTPPARRSAAAPRG
ncbi:MAG TPA: hypothetical protein VGR02_14910 [Thermoanaerobaculia bacterium]|jgi:hypothetical protein|nr:hypothetical protein [Thermoanaerobaculia bacterium]